VHPINALRADGMPIGELSRLCGVNIETIRYYEKIKMLPARLRTERGHRDRGSRELCGLGRFLMGG
jgi:MerR family transcriptional regulator, mercuric resistance operon regulatory protein